jgi:hypothetical protein
VPDIPQAGAAAEIVDVLIELGQHGIGVAVGKSPVQLLQAGSHAEDMAAQLRIAPGAGGLVQKCQQQTHIALHGARDIDQRQPGHGQPLAPAPFETCQLAARGCRSFQAGGPVHAQSRGAQLASATAIAGQRQADIARQLLHQAVLAGTELVEIRMLQPVPVAGRHGGIQRRSSLAGVCRAARIADKASCTRGL